MSAPAWTLRVTVSLPTNVPAPGLKRTARESDCAGGADWRRGGQVSTTSTSAVCRARRIHVLPALDIRVIRSQRECRACPPFGRPCWIAHRRVLVHARRREEELGGVRVAGAGHTGRLSCRHKWRGTSFLDTASTEIGRAHV